MWVLQGVETHPDPLPWAPLLGQDYHCEQGCPSAEGRTDGGYHWWMVEETYVLVIRWSIGVSRPVMGAGAGLKNPVSVGRPQAVDTDSTGRRGRHRRAPWGN